MILKYNYHLISEDEDEDFSKGAEEFVEAARKRRIERKSGEGTVHFRMYVTTGFIISVKLLFNYFFLLLIIMSCHHKWQTKCSLIHWFEVKL